MLVGAEKVLQVVGLLKEAQRRSLQEAALLLERIKDDDMALLDGLALLWMNGAPSLTGHGGVSL